MNAPRGTQERFLVTGCAGFIGSHLLGRLLTAGADVTGVDDFSTGARGNLEPFQGKFRFIEGDLCDPAVAAAACRERTCVFHLAAIPSVPRSVARPLESVQASILATVTLLVAAREAGVRRVVQSSSSSVYGETKRLPKVETLTPAPLSPYAVAKFSQELYGAVFCRQYGLDVVSLRYFNVFGPRQNPRGDYAAAVPKFILGMLAGRRPVLYGDGRQTRDFTYVENIVAANLLAARAARRFHGEALNIAGGRRISLRALVRALQRLLGVDLEPEFAPARPGDIRHSHASIRRARRLLGYRPVVSFEEGLRRTCEYLRGMRDES